MKIMGTPFFDSSFSWWNRKPLIFTGSTRNFLEMIRLFFHILCHLLQSVQEHEDTFLMSLKLKAIMTFSASFPKNLI